MSDLNPGEVRFSSHRPGGLKLGAVGYWMLALFFLLAARSSQFGRPSDSPAETKANAGQISLQQIRARRAALKFCASGADASNPNCLPPAPRLPGRTAAFTYRDPNRPDSHVAYVIDSRSLRVHVVDQLPEDIRSQGTVVQRSSGVWTGALPKNGPLIFYGDVDIDVGAIGNQDQMASMLGVQNSRIREFQMVFEPTLPRGPPQREPVDVYVVGTAHSYRGPDQTGRSKHRAQVFDLDCAASQDELQAYELDLRTWHQSLSEKSGLIVEFFASARSNDEAEFTLRNPPNERGFGLVGNEFRPDRILDRRLDPRERSGAGELKDMGR